MYGSRYGRFKSGLAQLAGSYEEAHDVVQEAFATAIRKRSDFRGDSTLEAWVWTIALRTALRHRGKRRETPTERAVEPTLIEPERDPDLDAALRALPPRRRLIVFLHYFADLSYPEIAAACEISEGTVAASLAQARAALAEALPREGAER